MLLKKILLLLALINGINSSFAQEQKISVYVFVTEECPVSISMAPSLKSTAERYAGKQTTFYLVFPFSTSTDKTAALFKTENKLNQFSIKIDGDQSLTKKLGATITPEVIITGAGETILYKGRINDSFTQPGKKKHYYTTNDLADALYNINSGREMPKPWKPAVGCLITIENE